MYNKSLVNEAARARNRAYAPYSKFAVGAALLTRSGGIFIGCNVENGSLGLTICAERAAVAVAIAQGHNDFATIAVVTDSAKPCAPCGACRQVLAEFNPTLQVVMATTSGASQELSLADVLPLATQGLLQATPNV
jgi:cytidine deaminase